MSLHEPIQTGEQQIEPGKRLIRAGDDRGLSLARWLSFRLQRLAWRGPFRGRRQPLKLLRVPKDPIAGDKAAGEAIMNGAFVHRGYKVPLERLNFADPTLPRELSDHLQSFAWLRDLAAATSREKSAKLCERVVRKWLEDSGAQVNERAWRADLWGKRLLFWSAYAPYILSSSDADYRTAVLKMFARGARHLEKTADKVPAGMPRVAAWAGVIASAVVVQGGPSRLGVGEAGLTRALAAAMHEDGGLVSRSPTEQLALVELLGQIRAVYISARRDMPDAIAEALDGSVSALLAVTLGDDMLSSWQGGNQSSKRRIEAAIEGSGVRARPLRQARGWGYQRMAAKKSVAVFDAAPPPATRALVGGCASTLAFEFSDGTDRLIVNCGGPGADGAALSEALVHGLRTTAAHSTLTLGDRNSTAVLSDGGLGRGVAQVELSRDETAGITMVEASHDGYGRRFGLLHKRQLTLGSDGGELQGEDCLVPQGKKRRSDPVAFTARFHLAPAVEVTSTADGQGALLRIKGGGVWQFRCRGGQLAIEDSLWIDGDARSHPSQQLVIAGETPPGGMTISWVLKRAA